MQQLEIFKEIKEITNGYLSAEVYHRIYQLAKEAEPGIVVDIGPAQGGSTISLGLALEENDNLQKVYSIDMFCKSAALKSYTDIDENVKQLFNNLNLFNIAQHVEAVVVSKDDSTLSQVKELISVLFIDADGAIDRDFEIFYNRLVPKGIIIIDDYKEFINIQSRTRFLKWQTTQQMKNFLDTMGLTTMLDYTPLGKQYSTFRFVNYLIEHNYIEVIENIEGTLFARKPVNAPIFNQEAIDGILEIRKDILKEYDKRHQAVRMYYEKIASFMPRIAQVVNMQHGILFENYYYAAKQRNQTVKVHEWHNNIVDMIENDLKMQDVSFEKIEEIIAPLSQGNWLKRQIDSIQSEKLRDLLEMLHIKSFIAIPIFVKQSFWGFLIYWADVEESFDMEEKSKMIENDIEQLIKVIEDNQEEINKITVL